MCYGAYFDRENSVMQLKGSCHCGAVRFSLQSRHPYPFNVCYCSICRKTNGGGGYAINLSGDFNSLAIDGEENISVYQAILDDGGKSPAKRNFCGRCGAGLWLWEPRSATGLPTGTFAKASRRRLRRFLGRSSKEPRPTNPH